MTVSKQDVHYALLALDAYNRHHDKEKRKLSYEDDVEISSQIGDATYVNSSDKMETAGNALSGSELSGFSASHYTINGQTLISYRGTDFDFSSTAGMLETLKDVVTGWLSSFNILNPSSVDVPIIGTTILKNQPHYAREFYELLTNNKIFPKLSEGEQPKETILVGHSLGGSLAGSIGSLTSNVTKIFNETPYIGQSLNMAIDAFIEQKAV